MSNVIERNFGAKEREAARQFARLFGILEAHAEDVLRRPMHYLQIASQENSRLYAALREADDALRMSGFELTSDPVIAPMRTVVVDEDDYNRLRACAEIVRRHRHRPPR